MNVFFKKNLIFILAVIILLIWSCYSVITWKEITYRNDPIILYYNIIGTGLNFIQLIGPLFVIIPATYWFHKKLHSGIISYYLTRMPYKKFILKNYFNSILKSLILPFFCIFLIAICCLKIKSISFGSGFDMYNYYASPEKSTSSNIYIFMLFYFINMVLNSIFYVNICLFNMKKNSNYLVTMILSFICFIGIEIVVDALFAGFILARILNIHNLQLTLSLFSIWTYYGVKKIWYCTFYYLLLVIISTIVIFIKYKNKEGVLIESEK